MTKPRYAATVARLPRLALFEARGTADALEAALLAASLPWPEEFNRIAAQNGIEVARIGPKRVLIMASAAQEDGLLARLELAFAAVATADFALMSDGFVAFSVKGSDAEQVLRQGAPLDLSQTAFPPGSVAGTELWAATAIIARINQPETTFLVLVDASYAGYFENWLAFANGLASSRRPGTMQQPPASLTP